MTKAAHLSRFAARPPLGGRWREDSRCADLVEIFIVVAAVVIAVNVVAGAALLWRYDWECRRRRERRIARRASGDWLTR
jgi:hypothetical protein